MRQCCRRRGASAEEAEAVARIIRRSVDIDTTGGRHGRGHVNAGTCRITTLKCLLRDDGRKQMIGCRGLLGRG